GGVVPAGHDPPPPWAGRRLAEVVGESRGGAARPGGEAGQTGAVLAPPILARADRAGAVPPRGGGAVRGYETFPVRSAAPAAVQGGSQVRASGAADAGGAAHLEA